ncbi:zinc ion binding protein isoform X3 [Wolffia australiana]
MDLILHSDYNIHPCFDGNEFRPHQSGRVWKNCGMEVADLHKVWEIKVLKRPREDEARRMLESVARQVQPIMRRRKWKVKVLSEFCPANSSLLGLNVGRGGHVKLRLRRPRGNFDFFSYEEVLDTMLHELCHIEHGPHDALFYKLWDDIRKECEELMAKGIAGTGLGFDAPGRRLGGYSLQPSLSSLRETSLAAAERRKITASLLPPGPKRLGGDGNIMASLTPVQAAAMAAERRILDDRWCASESQERSWISIASDDDVEEHGSKRSAVMLNTSVTEERLGKRIRSADLGGCSAGHDLQPSISGTTFSCGHVYNSEDQTAWECPVCTLINKLVKLAALRGRRSQEMDQKRGLANSAPLTIA